MRFACNGWLQQVSSWRGLSCSALRSSFRRAVYNAGSGRSSKRTELRPSPSAASSAQTTAHVGNRRHGPCLQSPSTTGLSVAGLQSQDAGDRLQAGFQSLVPKSRLKSTVKAMIEYVLEPPCLRPVAFLALSRPTSARLYNPSDNPIVNIIVKTRLKSPSECSACRQPCGHTCRMAWRNSRVNMAANYIVENATTKTRGFTAGCTRDFNGQSGPSIQRQPSQSTMKTACGSGGSYTGLYRRLDPAWKGMVSTATETQVWRPAEAKLRRGRSRRDEEDARNGEIKAPGVHLVETISPRRCRRQPRHNQTSTPA